MPRKAVQFGTRTFDYVSKVYLKGVAFFYSNCEHPGACLRLACVRSVTRCRNSAPGAAADLQSWEADERAWRFAN
jgi:hypothetical protein